MTPIYIAEVWRNGAWEIATISRNLAKLEKAVQRWPEGQSVQLVTYYRKGTERPSLRRYNVKDVDEMRRKGERI